MFSVYLSVRHSSSEPAVVTEAIGLVPDESRTAGRPYGPTGAPSRSSAWVRHVGPKDAVARVEDAICEIHKSWGPAVAAGLNGLRRHGWTAQLVIVQRIEGEDDYMSKGISLCRESIEWLAQAGASIDIDQYVL
ncbi:DUF4279 domain-containing protein [Actinocorallia aurantiaca]|uniref:DUF4279 domain-containing protein n=1 Tax=Actinocorallia aurantiaca TaxID=46204 RepID=A0ABN3U3L8_9ACTN